MSKKQVLNSYYITLKETTGERIFLLSVIIVAINCIIRKSCLDVFTSWMSALTYISWILMSVKILNTRPTIKSIIWQFLIITVVCLYIIKSQEYVAGIFFFRVFASQKVDEKRVVKYTFYTYLVCFIFIILYWCIKIEPVRLLNSDVIYGFYNINTVGAFCGMLMILYIYIHFKTLSFRSYIALLFINTIILILTQNRTTCYTIYFSIFLTIISISKHIKKISYLQVFNVIFAIAILLFLVITFHNSPIYLVLNRALSGRLFQANYYLNRYSISLFGKAIKELTSKQWHLVLDMGYIHLIVTKGVIFALLYTVTLIYSMYRKVKENDFPAFLVLNYVALHLLIEPFFCDMNLNISLIFFGTYFIQKKSKNIKWYIIG